MMQERYRAWHFKAKKFKKANKTATAGQAGNGYENLFPRQILFYRSTTTPTQYDKIITEEKEAILRGCRDAYETIVSTEKLARKDFPTALTIIAVSRSSAIKIFAASPNESSGTPGIVVNSIVTSPSYPNFYLHSHADEKDRTKAAHYTILYNDNKKFTGVEQVESVVSLIFLALNRDVLIRRIRLMTSATLGLEVCT